LIWIWGNIWNGKLTITSRTCSIDTKTSDIPFDWEIEWDIDPDTGSIYELEKITNKSVTTLPVRTANTKEGVESAMLVLPNWKIDEYNYTTTISGSSYNETSNEWQGYFTVTNNNNAENICIDTEIRSITIVIIPETAITRHLYLAGKLSGPFPFISDKSDKNINAAVLKRANEIAGPDYVVTFTQVPYITGDQFSSRFTVTNIHDSSDTTISETPWIIFLSYEADPAPGARAMFLDPNFAPKEMYSVPGNLERTMEAVNEYMTTDYRAKLALLGYTLDIEGYNYILGISNQAIDFEKLNGLLKTYDDIYTTNYDTILDDFLETQERFPYHLHGGFSINHKNKNPDGRYSLREAKLIWGELHYM